MTPPTIKELCEKATPGPWRIVRQHPNEETRARLIEILPAEGGALGDWSSLEICNMHCADDPIQIANAQLIARCSPSVMLAVLSALDNAYCTINNALEAERTSEAPITEQCHVFIDARKEIRSALNLLNGKAP